MKDPFVFIIICILMLSQHFELSGCSEVDLITGQGAATDTPTALIVDALTVADDAYLDSGISLTSTERAVLIDEISTSEVAHDTEVAFAHAEEAVVIDQVSSTALGDDGVLDAVEEFAVPIFATTEIVPEVEDNLAVSAEAVPEDMQPADAAGKSNSEATTIDDEQGIQAPGKSINA